MDSKYQLLIFESLQLFLTKSKEIERKPKKKQWTNIWTDKNSHLRFLFLALNQKLFLLLKLCSSKPKTFIGFVNCKKQAFLNLFLRLILREV